MKIGDKEITIKSVYTRGIDREYNEILLKDTAPTFDADGKTTFNLNPANVQKANDYLVCAMTWLSQADIDEMWVDDYNKLLEEINNVRKPVPSQKQ